MQVAPFDVSQSSLLIASLIVILPTLMIALSQTLRASLNRPANLGFGLLFGLVNVSNLVGESWVYYFLLGLLEIALYADDRRNRLDVALSRPVSRRRVEDPASFSARSPRSVSSPAGSLCSR